MHTEAKLSQSLAHTPRSQATRCASTQLQTHEEDAVRLYYSMLLIGLFTYQQLPAQQPKRDHLQSAAARAFLSTAPQRQREQPGGHSLARGGTHTSWQLPRAYVYVVERDRENESSGGERGRLYRPELVCELEQKRSIFIGRLLLAESLSLFTVRLVPTPLPICARCIRRSRPPGFNTVKDSYLSK